MQERKVCGKGVSGLILLLAEVFFLWLALAGMSMAGVTQAWVRRYNDPANNNDFANAIAVDGQSNVYVTGGSDGSGTFRDYATIKYRQTGMGGGALDLLLLD